MNGDPKRSLNKVKKKHKEKNKKTMVKNAGYPA